jgi:hypothetical protein
MQMSRVAFWCMTAGSCDPVMLTKHAVGCFVLFFFCLDAGINVHTRIVVVIRAVVWVGEGVAFDP